MTPLRSCSRRADWRVAKAARAAPAAHPKRPSSVTRPPAPLRAKPSSSMSGATPGSIRAISSSSFRTHEAPGFPEPAASWGSEVGIEDCDQVPFEPTIDAQPTTERADSPTGLSVDIGLPARLLGPEDDRRRSRSDHLPVRHAVGRCHPSQRRLPQPGRRRRSPGVVPPPGGGDQPARLDAHRIRQRTGHLPQRLQDRRRLKSPRPCSIARSKATCTLPRRNRIPFQIPGLLSTSSPKGPASGSSRPPRSNWGRKVLSPRTSTRCHRRRSPISTSNSSAAPGLLCARRRPAAPTRLMRPSRRGPGLAPSSASRPSRSPNAPTRASTRSSKPAPRTRSPAPTSPCNLALSREDGTEEARRPQRHPPQGLSSPSSAASPLPRRDPRRDLRRPRHRRRQIATPCCPASSQVGAVTSAPAPAPTPSTRLRPRLLRRAHKERPSLSPSSTPAVAGPLDLGTVVVRNALQIDPDTARITAVSDPIPTILHGIPLDLRDLRVDVNRPTSPSTRPPANRWPSMPPRPPPGAPPPAAPTPSRSAGCDRLGFKPKLTLSLHGPSTAAATPRSPPPTRPGRATPTSPAPRSSCRRRLPRQRPHRRRLHPGPVRRPPCPAGSIYGQASATSPILGYPLYGNVYLRSNPAHKLPDLVADLRGPATQPIEVAWPAKPTRSTAPCATPSKWSPTPRSPSSSCSCSAAKGLIEMSSGFCANPNASVKLDAQNGRGYDFNPRVKAKCGEKWQGQAQASRR